MRLKKICVIGTGMIGRSFIDLCQACYPELALHAFDKNSNALALIKDPNVHIHQSLAEIQKQADRFVFCACPWNGFLEVVESFDDDKRMIIGISRPPSLDDWLTFSKRFANRKDLIIPAIGIEPGLSEILLANMLDKEEKWKSVEIQCGGLVLPIPNNPLKYKRLFGDLHLPFDWKKAYLIEQGKAVTTERFSELEYLKHEELGDLECYHDGLRIPFINHEGLNRVEKITQKTIRWKGHTKCLTTLKELGLLSNQIHPQIQTHTAKQFLQIINRELLSLNQEDKTLSILQIKATDHSNKASLLSIEFYDALEQNSMALATNLPGLFFLENFLALSSTNHGVILAEEIVRGSLYSKLLNFLSNYQAKITEKSELLV